MPTTIDQRDIHTVPIKTTNHEKNRLTVCLAVKANRTKMKPYVVIPAKKVKELTLIPGVIEAASPNGCMNEKSYDRLDRKSVDKFFFPETHACVRLV